MKFPIYQVDAFTRQSFKGNPAVVCLLEQEMPAAWMQSVATEMYLSETAFLLPRGDDYNLRWFTPTTEVDLCGHATLASAHILYEYGFYDPDETIHFHTKSGIINSRFNRGTVEINMPRLQAEDCPVSPELLEVLGQAPLNTADFGGQILLAELSSPEAVRSFDPDTKKILALPQGNLVITARDDGHPYDFISRFFAPQTGIPEDPVTGIGHCLLGPYWASRLGKNKLRAWQASARGGEVGVQVEPNRVLLSGKAVTIMLGELQKSEK